MNPQIDVITLAVWSGRLPSIGRLGSSRAVRQQPNALATTPTPRAQ